MKTDTGVCMASKSSLFKGCVKEGVILYPGKTWKALTTYLESYPL